jgi:hypothetical protein
LSKHSSTISTSHSVFWLAKLRYCIVNPVNTCFQIPKRRHGICSGGSITIVHIYSYSIAIWYCSLLDCLKCIKRVVIHTYKIRQNRWETILCCIWVSHFLTIF